MSQPLAIHVQVRYAECDQQGHAFNAHYLTWLDMAHSALLSDALGLSYPELRASGIDVVVAESNIRYRSPANEDDELTIEVRVDPLTRTSMTSRYTIRRRDTLVAEAWLRHVCVTHGTTEKLAWPDPVRRALEAHASMAQSPAAAGDEETAPR
jgi:acyl-CoA thioester hydrolase